MARIPDRVSTGAMQRPRIAPRAVETGDLGLQSVSRALQNAAELQEETAQVQAKAAYDGLEGAFAEGFRPAAERYDGRAPGFARDQMAQYDALAERQRAGLSEDAQRAFDRVNGEARVRAFDRSLQVEASASAGREKRERELTEQAQTVSAYAEAWSGYVAERDEAWRTLDPSKPQAMAGMLAMYDRRAEATLAAAPEEIRPRLAAQFANGRADELLRLQGAESKLKEGWLATQAGRSMDALTNAVSTDPDAYDEAVKQLPAVLASLPPEVRVTVEPKAREGLALARFGSMINGRDFAGVKAELDSGRWDQVLSAGAKAQLLGRADQELNSDHLQLLAQTGQNELQAEVASVAETGVSTGFDPASLAPLGPAAVAAARNKVADARLVFDATQGMAGLTPKDQAAKIDLLKPKPGDPDYARKKEAYELGLQRLGAAQALQQSDPASAVQQAPESAALWRRAASAPNDRVAAEAWARDAIGRQAAWGLQPAQQRVLPKEEATRIAQLASKAEPGGRAEALAAVYAYSARFGVYGGKVLSEITRAGLDPVDATVLNITDADPVALAAYARGRERAPQVKLDKGQQNALTEQVAAKVGPLAMTFAQGGNGAVYADGLSQAVTLAAKAYVGDGDSIPEAVRKAARPYQDRYVVVGDGIGHFDGGFRVPMTVAAKQVPALVGPRDEPGSLRLAPNPGVLRRVELPAADAAQLGAYRLQRDIVIGEGANLYPRDVGGKLAPAQRQKAYADIVADRGRWVSTTDDGGLMLVVPDVRGGVAPVLDNAGKPITRTWDQLISRARQP